MTESNAFKALQHWFKLLKNGGSLVIECPDIEVVMRSYLQGQEEMLYSIYGRHRYEYDSHLWGYSRISLSNILRKIGFKDIVVSEGTDYHAQLEPCMRVEAKK
jgi:predicted SAM-dependent methyltransferase